jgi:hypothetical protein
MSIAPIWLNFSFIIIVLIFVAMIYTTIKQSSITHIRNIENKILLGLIAWIIVQSVLAYVGVYANYPKAKPPYIFLFGILPTLIFIFYLFFSVKGKNFLQSLPLEYYNNLHVIRIFVEFVLYFLCIEKLVPNQMSFLGSNFDIIIGITAPLISFFYFKQKAISRSFVLVWNIIGLIMLLHVVIVGILSAPLITQKINISQPNTAVLYFPYLLLVTFIVPVILLAHLISIKRLLRSKRDDDEATVLASEYYKTKSLW